MIKNKIINLDCTFRDGGYYNNWFFKKTDIDFYIKNISKTKIKYISGSFLERFGIILKFILPQKVFEYLVLKLF